MNTQPTLLAEAIPGDPIQVRVWCPHCAKYHFHGRGSPNATGNLGHRSAHCQTGPFKVSGYWLQLDESGHKL